MADLFDKFDAAIAEKAALGALGVDPVGVVMEKILSPTRAIINGRETVLLGTYNYMGMTFDSEVIAAGQAALAVSGSGTTGSRVLNGTYEGHKQLEASLCDFYGTTHAMVFSTGYQANLAMCSTLTTKGDYIIIDADSHASIYDGCSMGKADIIRFRHNNVEDLDKRLGRLPADAGKLVVLEGVYSMLGDLAPLAEMVRVARVHDAMILVDEAHAMGYMGARGRGVTELAGCENDVDFILGTFSKSVGTIGGYVVSNHPKFEILRMMCRPYMFTASLPPSVVATATVAIEKLKYADNKRGHLWASTRQFHAGLKAAGFQLGTESPESAIIAVMMPDQEHMLALWTHLLHAGFYVNMARPPATPQGMCLIRCSVCAEHTSEQVEAAIAAFTNAGYASGVLTASVAA